MCYFNLANSRRVVEEKENIQTPKTQKFDFDVASGWLRGRRGWSTPIKERI